MRDQAPKLALAMMIWALTACGSAASSESAGASGATAPSAREASPAPSPAPAPSDPRYYSDVELVALGFRIAPQSARPTREHIGPDGPAPTIDDYSFVCGDGTSGEGCVCRRELPCTARGDCVTMEENLRVFREALASTGDRQVGCERAEVGRCGDFRYFLFEGDIYRYELRWFDADGRLVGQRNTTDYPEYCNGTVDAQWMGRIPKCETVVREELICGEDSIPVATPLADLRRFAAQGR